MTSAPSRSESGPTSPSSPSTTWPITARNPIRWPRLCFATPARYGTSSSRGNRSSATASFNLSLPLWVILPPPLRGRVGVGSRCTNEHRDPSKGRDRRVRAPDRRHPQGEGRVRVRQRFAPRLHALLRDPPQPASPCPDRAP